MNQLIKHIRTQLYLAIRLPYFWIATSIMGFYCLANIINYGITYYSYSATGIISASDLYVLNDINSFWNIFSLLIPFICTFSFSMQPLNDKERGTLIYLNNRLSRRNYYLSGVLCSAISTFLIICVNVFLSIISLYIMFGENGDTNEGAKYSVSYWLNVESGYCYHFQELHTEHPLMYIVLITFMFAAFCSIISIFTYAIATLINKEKLLIILVAGIISFVINQIYLITGYNIYGDVTASTTVYQTGLPTIFIGVSMLLATIIIIRHQINQYE